MTEILSKLFIKEYKKTEDSKVREQYGKMSSIVGIIVNFILAGFKLLSGILASSVSITADALNNLSDAGGSVITFISFKISSKPPDKDHPFGHARMEYISSMIVSFLILLVGFELLIDSAKIILGLAPSEKIEVSAITIVVLSASIFLKLWLGVFYRKIGKKINSSAIKANATDSITDSISTISVLASAIIIKLTDFQLLDAILGIAVSALIIVAGAKILIETKNAILGEAPVEEMVNNIKGVIDEYPDIIGIHDLIVHNYGPCNFIASFHAEVDGESDVYYLHDTIDNLEREIKNRFGISCTIHMDPIVTNDATVNTMKNFVDKILIELGYDFNVHDFRVVTGATHTNLIFDVVVPFDFDIPESTIISNIENAVRQEKSDFYCVITIDRG